MPTSKRPLPKLDDLTEDHPMFGTDFAVTVEVEIGRIQFHEDGTENATVAAFRLIGEHVNRQTDPGNPGPSVYRFPGPAGPLSVTVDTDYPKQWERPLSEEPPRR